jgi:hypothetical protein
VGAAVPRAPHHGQPRLAALHDTHCTRGVWEACDFGDWVPSGQTLYLRFAELEEPRYVAAFTAAANCLIQIAAENKPRAFHHFHLDATPMHTHVLREHACPTADYCDRMEKKYGGGKPAKVLARANEDLVNDDRHDSSAKPSPRTRTSPTEQARPAER